MSERDQQLRSSQFILSSGPGSILETPSGPVVIVSVDRFFTTLINRAGGPFGRSPEDFEIMETRLSSSLGGARLVRIPTNDELGEPGNRAIYETTPFPQWALCTRHSGHQVLYEARTGCRQCASMSENDRRRKAGREAIRFVQACEHGHLDDISWSYVVHGKAKCRSTQFRWLGGGRGLRQSWLECTTCKARRNFGEAYLMPQRCRGTLKETGLAPVECGVPARITQRNASNLYVADHRTALTIGTMTEDLFDILSDAAIRIRVEALLEDGELDEATFARRITDNERVRLLPAARARLKATPWAEIEVAIAELTSAEGGGGDLSEEELRRQEFDFLQRAAELGVPIQSAGPTGRPPLIEVRRSDVRTVDPDVSRLGLRVTPVRRLRVVIAQTGYRRLSGDPNPVEFRHGASRWLPGVELFGEGIFIDIPDVDLPLPPERAEKWAGMPIDDLCETHPVFVWWHTLSHRLIRSLSIDSGYSSAAIRERIFIRHRPDGTAHGGVLLYTVQPGGDGTLGGLISMASRFEGVLASAIEDIDTCSNDPLCEESPLGNSAGAVCYSCLLSSETSCEWRNRSLDRVLLRDCPP